MRRHICFVLAGISVSSLAWAGTGRPHIQTFKSETVRLPDGDENFTGQNAEAINGNCLACHSAEMVLNQPPLSQTEWAAEVKKMINAFKAPVPAADVPAILAYLVAVKGKK